MMLGKYFKEIDINDMCSNLTEQWASLKTNLMKKHNCKLGKTYVGKAHEVKWDKDRTYDACVINWGFGYYDEGPAKRLLQDLRPLLKRPDGSHGIIITKETIKDEPGDDAEYEQEQGMWIRPEHKYEQMFNDAGYNCFHRS